MDSQLYGLIGSSIANSQSDVKHNRVMKELGLNASYVKIQLQEEGLASFFQSGQILTFSGLSVTMPFKERVIPFLDVVDEEAFEIGAVNTIVVRRGGLFGYNTDGVGALDALEKKTSVKGKRVAIIGAGGAARAIVYEAKKRGGEVFIFNRTKEKADLLADKFQVRAYEIDVIEKFPYDILINTTPLDLPIPKDFVVPNKVVMDIKNTSSITPLLEIAKEKGCIIVLGDAMWVNQAIEQYKRWFEPHLDVALVRSLL